MGKRVLVTGSRTWSDRETIRQALREQWEPGTTLVHGGCPRGGTRRDARRPHGPLSAYVCVRASSEALRRKDPSFDTTSTTAQLVRAKGQHR
jgi:hypothetical protein